MPAGGRLGGTKRRKRAAGPSLRRSSKGAGQLGARANNRPDGTAAAAFGGRPSLERNMSRKLGASSGKFTFASIC